MAKSKMAFNFAEMEELAARLETMGGDLQKACDKALHDTHDYITPRLSEGIAEHVVTGATKGSLDKSARVVWESPLKAVVNIGFDLSKGWPSIFLMWGTPKMRPETKLRNAAFGPAVRREVANIQRQALEEALKNMAKG